MKTGPIIHVSVGSVYGAQMRILLFLSFHTVALRKLKPLQEWRLQGQLSEMRASKGVTKQSIEINTHH